MIKYIVFYKPTSSKMSTNLIVVDTYLPTYLPTYLIVVDTYLLTNEVLLYPPGSMP